MLSVCNSLFFRSVIRAGHGTAPAVVEDSDVLFLFSPYAFFIPDLIRGPLRFPSPDGPASAGFQRQAGQQQPFIALRRKQYIPIQRYGAPRRVRQGHGIVFTVDLQRDSFDPGRRTGPLNIFRARQAVKQRFQAIDGFEARG